MDGVDVQLSVTNLVQMDRHQSDVHRVPVLNQEQNADAARQKASRRMKAPVETDKSEGRTIDPRARREQEQRKKKRQGKANAGDDRLTDHHDNSTGRFIDFEA